MGHTPGEGDYVLELALLHVVLESPELRPVTHDEHVEVLASAVEDFICLEDQFYAFVVQHRAYVTDHRLAGDAELRGELLITGDGVEPRGIHAIGHDLDLLAVHATLDHLLAESLGNREDAGCALRRVSFHTGDVLEHVALGPFGVAG